MYNIMTPGPTKVHPLVLKARGRVCTNPDLDMNFFEEYRSLCERISKLLHTKNKTFILSGEAILGLESAVASLCEKEDRILVISNGVFGAGFIDFTNIYGGNAVLYEDDVHSGINISKLASYLKEDHNFKFATLVHCDTPSGVLNDIDSICQLLDSYGILSVVDAVSSVFTCDIDVDQSNIDILIGGSQKALSVPPGLTLMTISDRAFQSMEKRKEKIASFYCNLLNIKNYYEEKQFPYTMPIHDIYGLDASICRIEQEKDRYLHHEQYAKAVRSSFVAYGLSLYLNDSYSHGVSTFNVPEHIKCDDILNKMKNDHQIMIAGSFSYLKDKVIRIGHMGENSNMEDITLTLDALDQTLTELGFKGKGKLKDYFLNQLNP